MSARIRLMVGRYYYDLCGGCQPQIQLAVDYDSDKSTICPFFYYSEDARTAHLPKPNRWKINKFDACVLSLGSLATVVQY